MKKILPFLLAFYISNNLAQDQKNIISEGTQIHIDSRCLTLRPEEVSKIQLEIRLRNLIKNSKSENREEILEIFNKLKPLNEYLKEELIQICNEGIEADSKSLKKLDDKMNKKAEKYKILTYATLGYFGLGIATLGYSSSHPKYRYDAYAILASSPLFFISIGLFALSRYIEYACDSIGLKESLANKDEIIKLLTSFSSEKIENL